MAISAYAISLLTAFIIQQLILKNKEILIADYISMSFIIFGLVIVIFRKEISLLF